MIVSYIQYIDFMLFVNSLNPILIKKIIELLLICNHFFPKYEMVTIGKMKIKWLTTQYIKCSRLGSLMKPNRVPSFTALILD